MKLPRGRTGRKVGGVRPVRKKATQTESTGRGNVRVEWNLEGKDRVSREKNLNTLSCRKKKMLRIAGGEVEQKGSHLGTEGEKKSASRDGGSQRAQSGGKGWNKRSGTQIGGGARGRVRGESQ